MAVPDKLKEVFIDVFGKSGEEINMDTNSKNYIQWDSLRHMELIAALEKKYSVKINFMEAMELSSVRDILNLIHKKKID